MEEKRVIGIGDIFFKCKDPMQMRKWNEIHLGIQSGNQGAMFPCNEMEDQQTGYTVWSIFDEKTGYFNPGQKSFMINYRVQNLERLIGQLKEEGIQLVSEMETYDYGKFAWIMDPEDNKMELWVPINQASQG